MSGLNANSIKKINRKQTV